tara:strand:- start:42 stop:521 length:480 start_codon:yes stop_codon:yes gene_type:complete
VPENEYEALGIILSDQMATVAAHTTLDLAGLIQSMKASGMSDDAIRQVLLADLAEGGRIFGAYKNAVKNTVGSAVGRAGNIAQKMAYSSAGIQEFRWVTAGSNSCPDCDARNGEVGTMGYWETVGLPKSGFSVCQQHCQCPQPVPVTYKGKDLDKPLRR